MHEFAVYLSKGNIVYPTTVIITAEDQPYYEFGILKPGEMEMLLKYYGSDDYHKVSLQHFEKTFK